MLLRAIATMPPENIVTFLDMGMTYELYLTIEVEKHRKATYWLLSSDCEVVVVCNYFFLAILRGTTSAVCIPACTSRNQCTPRILQKYRFVKELEGLLPFDGTNIMRYKKTMQELFYDYY